MNVILNTQALQYALTGVGWYTQNLLQGLQKHKSINQLLCIPNLTKPDEIIKKNIRFKTNLKNIIKFFPGTYSLFRNYQDIKFIKKTRFLTQDQFIYHEPCYILSPYSGPKICTIHDLSHIHYPDYHPKERVKYLRKHLPLSINKAHHIITGSDYTRNELIRFFSLSSDKITRIYHGVSKIFKPRNRNEIRKVLFAYSLYNKNYLLYVGTLEPRKNLENLIQAFKQLSESQRNRYPLVLIGIKGWKTRPIEKIIRSLSKKQQLYCLGYLPKIDIPYLYSGAYGFVYLSVYEGFGLPLLEAMASGIPTLASDQSAMPEVVGDAAMLVNPFDVDLIADKLNQLINDLSLRDRLKNLGPLQAAKFSWESCIENTLAIYRKILI